MKQENILRRTITLLLVALIFGFNLTNMAQAGTGSTAPYIEPVDTTDLLFRKSIPKEVHQAALEALQHYPGLQDKRITFKYDYNFHNAFMQAQPRLSSLLEKDSEREYLIIMTRYMKVGDERIAVEDLPHKVLVGWLGHELGHIKDYTEKGKLAMLWFGFRYLSSDKFKRKAERDADLFAIRHGLAEEIIATKNFILKNTALPKNYIKKIKRLYLSPESVLAIIEELKDERENNFESDLSPSGSLMETRPNPFLNNHLH